MSFDPDQPEPKTVEALLEEILVEMRMMRGQLEIITGDIIGPDDLESPDEHAG